MFHDLYGVDRCAIAALTLFEAGERIAANMATAKANQARVKLLRGQGLGNRSRLSASGVAAYSPPTEQLRRASPLARMPSLNRQIIDGALPIPALHKLYRPVLVSCPDHACDFSQFPRCFVPPHITRIAEYRSRFRLN